jgi:hypothetical protein
MFVLNGDGNLLDLRMESGTSCASGWKSNNRFKTLNGREHEKRMLKKKEN